MGETNKPLARPIRGPKKQKHLSVPTSFKAIIEYRIYDFHGNSINEREIWIDPKFLPHIGEIINKDDRNMVVENIKWKSQYEVYIFTSNQLTHGK